jgi:hypothetical protein
MAVLPTGIGPVTGYQIERSLRFNSADSAYLNRTPASAGSRTTWTWSAWIKRGNFSASEQKELFGVYVNATNFSHLYFDTTETLNFVDYVSGTIVTNRTSTPVYRDPSAWYHIVLTYDTTNATAQSRVRVYVNGVEITSFSGNTTPAQNYASGYINSANAHVIGQQNAIYYFGGYLTEVNFIDGQALTPSSFGLNDPETGVWSPKRYTGTYGTNGFFLKFADNSGTTSTTLGKDSSGNSNNWTPNNFSVTAGAGNDSMVDSPTAYGTDTGVGGEVRGNYCTWNSAAQSTVANGTVTRSNGNLESTDGGTTYSLASFGTMSVSSGKWYWEVTLTTAGGSAANMGIVDTSKKLIAGTAADAHFGFTYGQNGNKTDGRTYGGSVFSTNGVTAYGASYAASDVIGVALNLDVGEVTFYKNGVSQGVAFTGISGQFAPAVGDAQNATSYTWTLNAGQRPFAYTAPSGFKALCTTNLPTPTIGATSTTQANDYMNVVLYTGTGSSLSVTGVGFQPDWVWIKERNAAADHGLYDAVRGVQKQLESNTTTAETTETTGLTAFGSDGFTVGALAQLNTSADTYVAWNWNAGGSNATNTSGTITSTVRANTTSGFSIVTYTGTGTSGATVGHGLGVAPRMVILKERSNLSNWQVKHASLNANQNLVLNDTSAVDTAPGSGYISAISSTTLTLLNGGSAITNVNRNGGTYVAYCFSEVAGYSAFGSYTGNGSTDGPFVYTNFRPRYVMLKKTSATDDWVVFDTARDTFNVVNDWLFPNLSNAELTSAGSPDVLSNGFKLRSTSGATNASGATFIYAAFAETPAKFSLAR